VIDKVKVYLTEREYLKLELPWDIGKNKKKGSDLRRGECSLRRKVKNFVRVEQPNRRTVSKDKVARNMWKTCGGTNTHIS